MRNYFKEFFSKKKFGRKFQTGIVLSGGGTRGFAHLGVFKALEEHGIKPDIIAGVSAGSIAGVLYADGKSPEECLHILMSQKLLSYIKFSYPKHSFFKREGFTKVLESNLTKKNIEDLDIPVEIFAVNMNTAEYTCFKKGSIIDALLASSSIPVLFPPVKIGKYLYVDGGVINNFPVETLEKRCKRIIGVSVNPLKKDMDIDNLAEISERTFHLNIRSHALVRKDKCDLFIQPEGLGEFGLMEISKGKEIFDMGYKEAIKALKEKGWDKKERKTSEN